MADKLKGILAGVVLLFFGGLILMTPIGMILILAGAGGITWQLYEYLDSKGYERAATYFILFLGFPTILAIGGGVSWFVGCVFGVNGCRSPF